MYGFINIPFEIIFDLIEHPYFQRLRRIKQLGLTNLVYPGATHTRFQHAIGAVHLMNSAINIIRSKGHNISVKEAEAVTIAILLHDIGHGPFSHTLEHSLVSDIDHEGLSNIFMNRLNDIFKNKLTLAIEIFNNQYPKKFLHQLVSSQLDMDRLDYLNRDSFFTGVSEGVIGFDRIIKMLNVVNDQLVVEAKGIYSIEKFLISRRLMYWQVYFHKTVISAEQLLVKILKRAKMLAGDGNKLFATPALEFFLYNNIMYEDFIKNKTAVNNKTVIDIFCEFDDNDILASIKVWSNSKDRILAQLCTNLINRRLYGIEISKQPFDNKKIKKLESRVIQKYKISEHELDYFVFTDNITNHAYSAKNDKINILYNNGRLADITEASDIMDNAVLSKTVKKYFLCYPKEIKG